MARSARSSLTATALVAAILVGDSGGQVLEYVTDQAGNVLSTRVIPGAGR